MMPETSDQSDWLPEEYEPGLVSLVVPSYNREHLLGETLKSVFEQDYRPLEIVVVDDGSTDNTGEMVEKLEAPEGVSLQFKRIEHSGLSAARNAGATISRGEFLVFLDSDDVLEPGAITVLVGGIGDADLVFGRWRDWFSSEQPERYSEIYVREPSGDLLVDLLRNQWLATLAVLHRRSFLRRVGAWDESFPLEEDFDLMTRAALLGARTSAVPELVGNYRRHEGFQNTKIENSTKHQHTERVLKRVETALEERGWTPVRRAAMAWRWFFLARAAWLDGDRESFDRRVKEAKRVQPGFRAPKRWYRLIAGVAGYRCAEQVAAIGRKLFR